MVKDFLYADKKIYEPICGVIPFDEFEKELIDTIPFQRLHYIHQLGVVYLVYPGANHTRFEHSLSVMHIVSEMIEKICKSVRPDVFHFVPRKGSSDYLYWLRVLRMAALCHDLGHFPFSDSKDLGEWTLKIIDSDYLKPVWEKLRNAPSYDQEIIDRDIVKDIKKIAVGQKYFSEPFSSWEKVVSQLLLGAFLGADSIDCLLRDSRNTGVSYGLFDFHQLLESLRVLPCSYEGDEMQLGVDENGIEACEALVMARHFMRRRIYEYSSVKAYRFHLQRYLLETHFSDSIRTVDDLIKVSDSDIICALYRAARDPGLPGHGDAKCVIYRQHRFRAIPLPDAITLKDIEAFQVKSKIDRHFLSPEFYSDRSPQEIFDFPVSQRHVMIRRARECSEILLKVPTEKVNWVYVSPEHDLALVNYLDAWNK